MIASSTFRLSCLLLAWGINLQIACGQQASNIDFHSCVLRFDSTSLVELVNTKGLLRQESPFTVELWVRAQVGAGGPFALLGDYVLGKHPEVPYPNRAGWFLGVGQTSGGTLSMSSGFGKVQIGGSLGVDEGQWYHVAGVNEPDGFSIYVNGKLWFRKLEADQIRWKASPLNLHLGITRYHTWKIRDHQVDLRGLRISSTCLYKEEFEPPAQFEKRADTLLLLDFAHPDGETITDLSGNQHHGTIRGARWLACNQGLVSPAACYQNRCEWSFLSRMRSKRYHRTACWVRRVPHCRSRR